VVMYREFGEGLAQALGRPWLFAPVGIRETTDFVRELGRLLGTEAQAEAFIEQEKRETLQPLWDLWRGPQGDWFSTTEFAVVAGRTYADGLVKFLGDELGMRPVFATGRPIKAGEMDNLAVREFLHKRQPGFVFGSINEKIYLSEAGARATHFIPASFPGPIVRRALGTPFMGYSGAVYIVQEMVNRFYESVFNFLPIDAVKPAAPGGPSGAPVVPPAGRIAWSDAARAQLDAHLENIPWLSRISASRDLRAQVEAYALRNQIAEVTPEVVERALQQVAS
ncbi:MAG: nitrogenase component 1, partial [Candidatus Roseilinea sp.]|uniref:nitrogenase component 1 n=1 Tax=Candidatus Roseilinea sp. TaxID=2838777 RepID=UPI0040496CD7